MYLSPMFSYPCSALFLASSICYQVVLLCIRSINLLLQHSSSPGSRLKSQIKHSHISTTFGFVITCTTSVCCLSPLDFSNFPIIIFWLFFKLLLFSFLFVCLFFSANIRTGHGNSRVSFTCMQASGHLASSWFYNINFYS